MELTLGRGWIMGKRLSRGEVFLDTGAMFCKLDIRPLHNTNRVAGFSDTLDRVKGSTS